MGLVRKESSHDVKFATGGPARNGVSKYTKKTISDKHLPDMKEAPNPFTDQDNDEKAGQERRPEQEQQDYSK